MHNNNLRLTWVGPGLFVISFVIVLGTVLWIDYRRAFRQSQDTLAHELIDVKNILTYRLEYDRHFLVMLAEQMSDGYLTQPRFEKNVSRYVSNRIYLVHVTWSGPDGVEEWHDRALSPIQRLPEQAKAMTAAFTTRDPTYSRPYPGHNGDFLFDLYVPVFRKNTFLGTFTWVYSCRNFLKFVHSRKHLSDQYLICLTDRNGDILAQRLPSGTLDSRLVKQTDLNPPGQGISLGLEGRKITFSNWQKVMLVSGCFMITLGMGWSMGMMKREIFHRKQVEEALVRDMAERRKAEVRLQQSQNELAHALRVATVGQMAGSLAHELNQPLCSISTYADTCLDILKSGTSADPDVVTALEEVANQSERAGHIIRHIKDFLRKGEPKRSAVDINDLARKVLALTEIERSRRGIRLELVLDESLPMVQADPTQIEQVVLNLIQNSMDALSGQEPNNRKLSVQTAHETENRVRVCVTDSGPGLSAEARAHLFEAFFTTKSQGLGMGLSISRSIIENHGGKIWWDSNARPGTSFQIDLPI